MKDKLENSQWYSGGFAKEVMYQTYLMTFSQNLHLKDVLLKTKDSRMVEAIPTNKRWDVVLNIKSPEIFDPNTGMAKIGWVKS